MNEEQNSQDAEQKAININIVDQTPDAEDLINGQGPEAPTVEPEMPAEPKQPEPLDAPKSERENAEINIDPEHAFEDSNEDYFRTTREKLASLRKERNELIVSMDKKEDELTMIERKNNQFANRGIFEQIDHEQADKMHREIHELQNAIMSKNRTIETLSGVLRTL